MEFPAAAVERAMTYQQVIMRALAGTWTWLKAADVLGIHPRSLRRWRARYERIRSWACSTGAAGGPRTAPRPGPRSSGSCSSIATRYQGFNVRHFLHIARRDHGVTLSYTLREARPAGGRPRPQGPRPRPPPPAPRAPAVRRRAPAPRRQ